MASCVWHAFQCFLPSNTLSSYFWKTIIKRNGLLAIKDQCKPNLCCECFSRRQFFLCEENIETSRSRAAGSRSASCSLCKTPNTLHQRKNCTRENTAPEKNTLHQRKHCTRKNTAPEKTHCNHKRERELCNASNVYNREGKPAQCRASNISFL